MASPSVELAVGYVTLAAETSQISKQIGSMFNGADTVASKTGKSMGKAMAKSFQDAGPDLDGLRKDVETAEQKITASVERNARKQEDARRKVEIATAKAAEAVEKYGEKSSQALTAVDRLAIAEQKLEAAAMAATADQAKLNAELDQSKAAFRDAERAAEASAKGTKRAFSGVGDSVKAAFKGDFKTAFKSLKGDASKAADGVEREFKDAGRDAGRGFSDGFKDKLKGALAGAGAVIGVGAMASGIGEAVSKAADLEQSVGAIQSVFKSSAGQMETWSQTAATSVGLSQNEFNELGTLIGAQLKNAGTAMEDLAPKTNDLIGLGADLSSMFGGSTKEAVEALSSALKGERDPIEKYGVSLNQAKIDAEAAALGFEKVGGALSAEATAAATMSLIMKQTTDAHGNFAKEADTFAGKQQRMAAQWDDLRAKIGEGFMPILSDAMGFVTGTAIPAFGAFSEATKPVREAIAGTFGWLKENRDIWGPFAVGVGLVATAYGVWAAASWVAATAQTALASATWAAMAPVLAWVAGIGLVAGAVIWAYKNVEWFRDLVNTAWARIQAATAVLVEWWTGVAFPALQVAVQWLGEKLLWLWHNVAVPAFAGIGAAVRWAWVEIIKPVFDQLVGFVRDVIAPAALWLWHEVIAPAFAGIGAAVSWAWVTVIRPALHALWAFLRDVVAPVVTWLWHNVVRPAFEGIGRIVAWVWENNLKVTFAAIEWFLKNILGPAIRWLWNNVAEPAFRGIGNAAKWAWENVIRPAFNGIKDGIALVRDGFVAAKDGIATAWDGIRKAVAKPINAVISRVINPFIGGYNKLNNFWSGEDLGKLPTMEGYRKGGRTGGFDPDEVRGVVHGKEFVLTAERVDELDRVAPGFLDSVHRYGASALPSFGHEGHAARGGAAAGGPGGPGTYLWGALQNRIYSSGVAHVAGSAPGYDLRAATRAWNNIGDLNVRYGRGVNQINVGSGAPAGTWGYAWTNGQIQLNPGVPQAMKTGVAAHEIGHVLGLDHAGTNSIMHPMMRGPLWPSAYDRASIQRIYGGAGEGNPPEGGGTPWWLDKIQDLVTAPLNAVKSLFAGNKFAQFPIGVAEKLVKDALGFASGGGAAATAPTLYDGGGWLHEGVQLIDHQRSEPDAVLTASQFRDFHTLAQSAKAASSNGGPLVQNLYVFDADEAMRKLHNYTRKQELMHVGI